MTLKFKLLKEYFEEPPIDYHTGDVEGKEIFDRKTHVPFYDRLLTDPEYMADKENLKGEIVMMSPNEYYRECANKIFNNVSFDDLMAERRANKKTIEYLTKLVTQYKRKMFMPYINYAERGQEGLHRMMVAGDLFGWDEKFPVLVITTYDQERKERKDREKEKDVIYRVFQRAVDRYRYPQDSEEALDEKIRDYIQDYFEDYTLKYYDPLNYTMWYSADDREHSGYDTCLVFDFTDQDFTIEINAEDITFWDDEEIDDDFIDDIEF